jgi:hypothetical protein
MTHMTTWRGMSARFFARKRAERQQSPGRSRIASRVDPNAEAVVQRADDVVMTKITRVYSGPGWVRPAIDCTTAARQIEEQ